ncbi:MAG: cytochrome c maturation protein CcmE [Actinobacteria bacterium]|nr:cytochrome c maturation protein CcmE [Actinomycetota bacterium]
MVDKKSKQRLLIVTVILLIGLVFFAFKSTSSAAYMRTIKEVQDEPAKYMGSTVRVTGKVIKDTIEKRGTTYRFKIADKGSEMTIEYSKSMPSTFGADIQVIALGKLASKDELKANEIVTKCPSKYQSKVEKAKTGGNRN